MGELKRCCRMQVFLILLIVCVGFALSLAYLAEGIWAVSKFDFRHVTRSENFKPKINSTAPLRAATDLEHWWCSGQGDPTEQPLINGSELQSVANINNQNLVAEKYFLTAVLVVRIFANDIGKTTARDLVHWLQYLSWAGVEHVYVYDSYLFKNESQRENLRCFIENGFVTYVDWSHRTVPNIRSRDVATQIPANNDCLQQFGHLYVWQLVMDIDEYPYSSRDKHPGFLPRTIKKILKDRKIQRGKPIALITFQSYVFMGKPLNENKNVFLIDRFWRRTKEPFLAHRTKYVYLSRTVWDVRVHYASFRKGFVNFTPNAELLRMNHYHGDRHNIMGDAKILNMTKDDWGMKTALSALQVCHKGCSLGCC